MNFIEKQKFLLIISEIPRKMTHVLHVLKLFEIHLNLR